jgi:SAM-dependent methyltransferase
MNLVEHNRLAWNAAYQRGNKWTVPVGKEVIDAAAQGEYEILLTPFKPVPMIWLRDVTGRKILCLASGGGQQGPTLAAAGAEVTVFDNSDEQLKKDEMVSKQFNLGIKTVQGNMQDLSCFIDNSFDMIIHPISNCFIDNILPVWKESSRVLKQSGSMLSGWTNPLMYMINWDDAEEREICELRHSIPYSDVHSLSPEDVQIYIQKNYPFEFGHTLTDQIQGQIEAGFVIAGFYEDKGEDLLDPFTDIFIATRAIKCSVV